MAVANLTHLISQIFSITLIDLTLSGDNAAVIGLAIRKLDAAQAKRAALLGASFAIALRIVLTALATTLTSVPYLSAIGSLVLVFITWKLVSQNDSDDEGLEVHSRGFWSSVWSIVIADVSMAFDNVIAVAGAAHGSVGMVILGLALSFPILIWGSTWIAGIMRHQPMVMYLGAAVLAHTAAVMFFDDNALGLSHQLNPALIETVPWILFLIVILYGLYEIKHVRGRAERQK